MASFNLTTQSWIPVRTVRGDLVQVSLEDALLGARDYLRIEDSSPLVAAAIHRLLAAVLHRALAGPNRTRDVVAWFEDGFPTDPLLNYLAAYEDRFDLFDPERPFYQVARLETGTSPVTRLAAERASGTNKLLFDHSLDDNPLALSPALAARWLLARQMLAVPEGAGYSPSPIGGAAVVTVQGNDLHETLCLNLPVYSARQRELDQPLWEAPQIVAEGLEKGQRLDSGRTRRYTWVSRFVRLEAEELRGETRVRWMSYAAGFKPEAPKVVQFDPMVAYWADKNGVTRMLGFREGRALWRDFHALLPSKSKGGAPEPAVIQHAIELLEELGRNHAAIRTLIAGAANDKAKMLLWRQEAYPLPAAVFGDRGAREEIEAAIDAAEMFGRHLDAATNQLAAGLLARGDRKPEKGDVYALASHLGTRLAYWSTIGERFVENLLPNVNPDDPGLRLSWNDALRKSVLDAWELATRNVGTEGWALKAVYVAERSLRSRLAERTPEVEAA